MRFVELARGHRRVANLGVAFSIFALGVSGLRAASGQEFRPTFAAQDPETLPPPVSAPEERVVPEECKPVPADTPLGALMIDVRPRDIEGNLITPEDLPTDCATHLFPEARALYIDTNCCHMHVCQLLQLAAYCHNPLYFEERLLERYGKRTCCCQPLQSAACFYGNALCLPAKMWRNCPCSCVPAHPCD